MKLLHTRFFNRKNSKKSNQIFRKNGSKQYQLTYSYKSGKRVELSMHVRCSVCPRLRTRSCPPNSVALDWMFVTPN